MGLRIAPYNSNFRSYDLFWQLWFAAEEPVHFAQLNSELFSLGEYVFSPVQSALEV